MLSLVAAGGCQQVPRNEFTTHDPNFLSDTDSDSDTDGGGTYSTTTGVAPPTQPVYLCDPADPEACPVDQKCSGLYQNEGDFVFQCVNDDTALDPYQTCVPSPGDGQDACPKAHMCQDSSFEATAGLCISGCRTSADCSGGVCVNNPHTGVPHCAQGCDPLLPNCPSILTCKIAGDQFGCQLAVDFDDGITGDPCDPQSGRGCTEGFVCLQGELVPGCSSLTGFCCTSVCDQADGSECVAPASCSPVLSEPAPGYGHIGACYVPT
ncbi:MAG: hypothetical protein ACPG4T_09420 [Nannocystaceae bacterium]